MGRNRVVTAVVFAVLFSLPLLAQEVPTSEGLIVNTGSEPSSDSSAAHVHWDFITCVHDAHECVHEAEHHGYEHYRVSHDHGRCGHHDLACYGGHH